MIAKFKVWDKRDNTWLTDYEEVFMNEDGEIFLIEERSWAYQSYMHKENITDDVDVVWFTGLKDKNGKEIYEGDILWFEDFDFYNPITEYKLLPVKYDTDEAIYVVGDNYCSLHEIADESEIKGNIYENADLMEDRNL